MTSPPESRLFPVKLGGSWTGKSLDSGGEVISLPWPLVWQRRVKLVLLEDHDGWETLDLVLLRERPVLVLVQVHGEERDVVLLKHLRGLGPLRLRLLAVTAPRGVKENAREVSATDLVVEVVNGELERLECVVATLLLRLHDARRERQRQTKQNQQILGVHGRRSPHVFFCCFKHKTKETKER